MSDDQGNSTGHCILFGKQNVNPPFERETDGIPCPACLVLAWRHWIALLAM